MSNYEQILEDDFHGHDSEDHWNYVRLFQKSERRYPARDYEREPLTASEFDEDWEETS